MQMSLANVSGTYGLEGFKLDDKNVCFIETADKNDHFVSKCGRGFKQLLKYPACGVITFILYKSSHPSAIAHIDFRINQTAWGNPKVIHPLLFLFLSLNHTHNYPWYYFFLLDCPFFAFHVDIHAFMFAAAAAELSLVFSCWSLKGNLFWSLLHNQCQVCTWVSTFRCLRSIWMHTWYKLIMKTYLRKNIQKQSSSKWYFLFGPQL